MLNMILNMPRLTLFVTKTCGQGGVWQEKPPPGGDAVLQGTADQAKRRDAAQVERAVLGYDSSSREPWLDA